MSEIISSDRCVIVAVTFNVRGKPITVACQRPDLGEPVAITNNERWVMRELLLIGLHGREAVQLFVHKCEKNSIVVERCAYLIMAFDLLDMIPDSKESELRQDCAAMLESLLADYRPA